MGNSSQILIPQTIGKAFFASDDLSPRFINEPYEIVVD